MKRRAAPSEWLVKRVFVSPNTQRTINDYRPDANRMPSDSVDGSPSFPVAPFLLRTAQTDICDRADDTPFYQSLRTEQRTSCHKHLNSTTRRRDGCRLGPRGAASTTRRKRLASPHRASRCPPSAWPDRRWAAAPLLQRAPRHGDRAVSEVATPRHAAAGRRRFLAAARLLRRGRDDGTGRPAAPRIRLTTRTRARPHSARGRYTTAASRPLVLTTSGGTPHP